MASCGFYLALVGALRGGEVSKLANCLPRGGRRLFDRLSGLLLVVFAMYLLTWVMCEGTKVTLGAASNLSAMSASHHCGDFFNIPPMHPYTHLLIY